MNKKSINLSNQMNIDVETEIKKKEKIYFLQFYHNQLTDRVQTFDNDIKGHKYHVNLKIITSRLSSVDDLMTHLQFIVDQ